MARPQISKTPLGQRLAEVRRGLGYDARLPFSQLLEIHPETLGGYERGDSVPNPDFFAMYRERFGVNLNWLFTGTGQMFSVDEGTASMVPPALLAKLAALSERERLLALDLFEFGLNKAR